MVVAISSRSVLFFRDYRGIAGGHIKVSDYFDHLLASELYDPSIYLTPNSQPNHLWQSGPVVNRYEPESADILFVAGMDWSALSHWPGIEDRKPVVNLVQHLRHADPDDPRYQFLNRRAIRVCVSKEVGDALMQTGRCNGPVHVVPNGVDIDLSASAADQRNTSDVFIAGLKQPEIAIRLASILSQKGLQITCATRQIDRSAFLSLMAGARIVVALPGPTEGFYLPALEAMKLGKALVCPDAVGNRSFCINYQTALMPRLNPDDLARSVEEILRDPQLERRLIVGARKVSFEYSIERERHAFLKILDAET